MGNKVLLELFGENHIIKCVGCGACVNSCNRNVLSMKKDEEGFYYPNIEDESLCVQCGKCLVVCPINNFSGNSSRKQFGYTEELETCSMKSSSGGVFYRIATEFVKRGGWVCGSIYDAEHRVITICSNDMAEIQRMRGSKYVASEIGGLYEEIKKRLEDGELVLYCSIPCQIAGLCHYLQREYENLYLIDLFCYGTPSQKLFLNYLEWKECMAKGSGHGKIKEYEFRDKTFGWEGLVRKITYEDGTEEVEKHLSQDPYFCSFIAKKTLRESCYRCVFCRGERYGDISIGDFWGIKELGLIKEQRKLRGGVSAVLINTDKGEELLSILQERGIVFETTLNDIKKNNLSLVLPPKRPSCRDKIYKSMDKVGFEKTAKRYMYMDSGWRHRILKFVPLRLKRYVHQKIKNI